MKKYVLLLLVILSTLSIYAQSGMTDTQVMEFVVKEHNKGYITGTDCNEIDAKWCRYSSN